MIWRWALSMVPWRTIVLHTPTIVKAARRYYGMTRTTSQGHRPVRPAEGIESVRRALEEQAALVDDLTRQVREITAALEVLQTRVRLALIGAWLAVAVALVTAALVVWRAR